MNYNKLIIIKDILITGGAGFFGSQLAYKLLKNDNVAHVLNNYSTGNANA